MSFNISKILYPTDFSEHSLHALTYARELATQFDAQIHCVHVIDEAFQYWTAMGPESIPMGPGVEDVQTMAEGQMARFTDEHLIGLKYAAITKTLAGRPFAEIVRYARDNSIDLIVLSTHGRCGLAHVLVGSTTEKVVRKADCPVLTVRHPDSKFEMP